MVWTLRVGLAGILVGASMVPARRRRVLLGTGCCQEKQRMPVQVTTLGRALPYSSRTSLPAARTSGSLSTSLANPTPPQIGVCQQGDSPPELQSPALLQLPEASEHPRPARHAPRLPRETRAHATRQCGTRHQKEPHAGSALGRRGRKHTPGTPTAMGSRTPMATGGQGHRSPALS